MDQQKTKLSKGSLGRDADLNYTAFFLQYQPTPSGLQLLLPNPAIQ
jgi:hypothetical protein